MEDLQEFIKKSEPGKARKRLVDKSKWKCEVLREKRYKSNTLPEFPTCGHSRKAFQCANFSCTEIRKFHQSFYKHFTKISQDNFIIKHCTITASKTTKNGSKLNHSLKYFIRKKCGKMVPVCQETFTKALCVKKDRIQGVMRRFYEKVELAKERRGGDRKSQKFEEKRKTVQAFIKSFKATESHYCRSKTMKRMYLAPELNIKKLWRMYNKDHPYLEVKQHFFRNIFNTCYNIGFGTPRNDVCSTCLLLDERIKKESNTENTNKLMTEKRVHRLRFKAFYEILQEQRPDLLIISFDCQKNLALPKVPDQSAYYSRQINFYNFTIVVGNSKAKLNKENIFAYTWNETMHNKGSNEIISAVHHFLTNLDINENIKVYRIVADGCSGQNKNSGMVAMLGKWLTTETPRHIKKVEIFFPVVGHSFIPPDRVFAQIEKDLKRREVIASPEEYQEIIDQYCTTTALDAATVRDWKSAYAPIIKPTTSCHVQFQKCKRFFLTRSKTNNVLLQGELSYKIDINEKKSITKKTKSITMLNPGVIQANQIIPKKAKIADVSNQLKKHYGEQWRDIETLAFYKRVEDRRLTEQGESDEDAAEIPSDFCEDGFDDINLIV